MIPLSGIAMVAIGIVVIKILKKGLKLLGFLLSLIGLYLMMCPGHAAGVLESLLH